MDSPGPSVACGSICSCYPEDVQGSLLNRGRLAAESVAVRWEVIPFSSETFRVRGIFLLSAMLLCDAVPFLTKESKRDCVQGPEQGKCH